MVSSAERLRKFTLAGHGILCRAPGKVHAGRRPCTSVFLYRFPHRSVRLILCSFQGRPHMPPPCRGCMSTRISAKPGRIYYRDLPAGGCPAAHPSRSHKGQTDVLPLCDETFRMNICAGAGIEIWVRPLRWRASYGPHDKPPVIFSFASSITFSVRFVRNGANSLGTGSVFLLSFAMGCEAASITWTWRQLL